MKSTLIAFTVVAAFATRHAVAAPLYELPSIPAAGTPIIEITDNRDHMPGAPESSGPYTYGIYGISGMVPAIYDPTTPPALLAEIERMPDPADVYYSPDFLIHYQGLGIANDVMYTAPGMSQVGDGTTQVATPAVASVPFPEPSSIVLAVGGALLLGLYRLRRAGRLAS
jgi:hypothetical protein